MWYEECTPGVRRDVLTSNLHIRDCTFMTCLKWKTNDVDIELTYKLVGPKLTFMVGRVFLALVFYDKIFLCRLFFFDKIFHFR